METEFSNNSQWSRVKVSDFGLSRLVSMKESELLTGGVGTCNWMPPELIENLPYDLKVDVYSYGIILWEIATRELPYKTFNSRFAIMQHVTNGGRPNENLLPADTPPDVHHRDY